MGRYYQNQQGEEGKFWFAVQPSDDPQTIYGMDELSPAEIDSEEDDGYDESWLEYWTDDEEFVRLKLDTQFVHLGVIASERRYDFKDTQEIGKYVWEDLAKYFLTKDKPKDERVIPYAMEGGDTIYPTSKDKELAASRIQLGLFILYTIKKYGECSLTAEL